MITFKVEESGNVSVYIDGVFYDKYANMSEAKDRVERMRFYPNGDGTYSVDVVRSFA